MTDTERRYTRGPVAVRDGQGRSIGGYAAKFNRLSQDLGGFVERISPAFFNKSAGDGWPDVMARYNHDDNLLLGTTDAGTLRLSIDDTGLDYVVDPPASRADVVELIARGDVRQSSFAFQIHDQEWSKSEQGYPMRTLLSGRLMDVAPVNSPAYLDTSTGLRSLADHVGADPAEVIEAARAGELRRFLARPPATVVDLGTATRAKVDEGDWNGDAARYTPEQWRRACLIDTDEGDEDSKGRYKLPVREPDGTLSRAGCHAAASVLGGGRGGVDATDAQKRKAARKLATLYRDQLEEDPPESLLEVAGEDRATDEEISAEVGQGETHPSEVQRQRRAATFQRRIFGAGRTPLRDQQERSENGVVMDDYIRRLHELRMRAWKEAQEVLDRSAKEKRDPTAEEDAQYLRASADLDALDERINSHMDAQRKAAEAEETFAELIKTAPVVDETGERGGRGGRGANAELRSWLRGESGRVYEVKPLAPVNWRTLTEGTATDGKETVQTSFYARLVQHMIEVSGVLRAGPTVLSTSTGEELQVPQTTAHSDAASIVAEAGTLSANEPQFGQISLNAFKYGFTMQVSHELVNDTSVDLIGYLSMQAGRALGNGFGAHLVTGTGTSQPKGVVTAATAGKTGTATTGLPSADDLIDLFHSVIAPYRNSGSCGWLMSDTTVAAIRKIRDDSGASAGTGNYMWQPGLTAGAPDTILGKPVRIDPNVPDAGTSKKSIVFGDFSAYFVRQVEGLRFERSDDFAFDSDVVTYRALLRGDGDLVDTTGALKYFIGDDGA